jgi:hypothetical protein
MSRTISSYEPLFLAFIVQQVVQGLDVPVRYASADEPTLVVDRSVPLLWRPTWARRRSPIVWHHV